MKTFKIDIDVKSKFLNSLFKEDFRCKFEVKTNELADWFTEGLIECHSVAGVIAILAFRKENNRIDYFQEMFSKGVSSSIKAYETDDQKYFDDLENLAKNSAEAIKNMYNLSIVITNI